MHGGASWEWEWEWPPRATPLRTLRLAALRFFAAFAVPVRPGSVRDWARVMVACAAASLIWSSAVLLLLS